MSEKLAVDGGAPVRGEQPWPVWPQWDARTEHEVLTVLRSARWTVSWPSSGRHAVERQFAQRFAEFHGVTTAVAVDHGSSALVVALEALDVGPGDEVIVPTMTWVATASAVLRVGALPVLADVDPASGCLTAEAVRALLSPRTKAVIVVHLACTVADLDGLRQVVDEAGVALVEDCAQAHGAQWRGRKVGTVGDLGAFSFQQGKVLASGEGGAVVTSRADLDLRLQQLRADARIYANRSQASVGAMELIETGGVIGANHCLAEMQAAILVDQLPRLTAQREHRELMASALSDGLTAMGLGVIPVPKECDQRSIYEFGVRFRPGDFGDASVEQVCRALTAELGRRVYPAHAPLYRSVLFRPGTKRRFAPMWTPENRARCLDREFPGAEEYYATTILTHHSALLGTRDDVADILRALDKVRRNHDQLRSIAA